MITTPQSRHTPCQFPLHRGAFKYASYDRNPAQLFDRSGITHNKNTIHLDGVFVMSVCQKTMQTPLLLLL